MKPSEFLDVARLISGAGPHPQGRRRSAVSRSYYSAFLDARDRLRGVPHVKLVKHNIHDMTWKALVWGDRALKPIGRLLQDLKKMRERADYELGADIDESDVREALRMAEDIQSALATADISKCGDPIKGPKLF